ncbi:GH39 family glycosyl hydrolase [Clostridium cellulovorans]|uniref:Transcriptional regulator, AraC family n=2 Tax=Clostridium cellulovorans TaxID=1493 RepID=D9SW40_CLOC7|nr:helix-turn-helix domain-containing protein [Clostridium cellulovorans]ADL51184.1 transcriptional regulator, AraC family [Clostridium cellulovorans 743B]
MKYEIINYDEKLPIKIFVAKLNNYPPHWHDEIEIVKVLEGKIKVSISESVCFLEKGEMAIIKHKEIHQIQSLENESLLQIIQINYKFMETHFPHLSRISFENNLLNISKDINLNVASNLKQLINEMINYLSVRNQGYEFHVISAIYKVFGSIISNVPYTISTEDELEKNNITFNRMKKIIEYIEQNYMNEININTLAEILHLNKYYIAHFFKKHTGLSLGQYITNLRMNKATELLIKNEDSITNIILSCGFKNIKYFYKVFREVYKCSPLEYKNNRQERSNKKVHESEVYQGYIYYTNKFQQILGKNEFVPQDPERSNKYISSEKEIRNIYVDFNDVKGKHNKYASLCVGGGRAGEVLRKDYDNQLDIISKECGFKYLKVHGIFHDELGVCSINSEGKLIYNWQYIDKVYDNILEKGMKPFVELSFMPLALASGDKTCFWWKANVTPPKDYNHWYHLVNSFVKHLEERYGRGEIITWYFEVWNEPNHGGFFSGDMQEYFKLYDYTAKAVKDVYSGYRVGGPASAGNCWIDEIIEHCSSTGTPLDFITTHHYGINGFYDEYGECTIYLDNKDTVVNGAKGVKERVMKSSMPNLEIHYTEWSSSCNPRDPIHDSYIEAPYILHSIKNFQGVVDSMSYWSFTDIFEEGGPPPTPFHGGFGLINTQSLKKAAYFAYKFIHELGEYELNNEDVASWVCKNENEVQALFWDLTIDKQGDVDNRKYFNKDMPPADISPVALEIKGIPKGWYQLELYRIGYEINDVYTEYIKMGSPDNLSCQQVEELCNKNSGKPFLVQEVNIDSNGKFAYHVDMRENDVCFIKLKKI